MNFSQDLQVKFSQASENEQRAPILFLSFSSPHSLRADFRVDIQGVRSVSNLLCSERIRRMTRGSECERSSARTVCFACATAGACAFAPRSLGAKVSVAHSIIIWVAFFEENAVRKREALLWYYLREWSKRPRVVGEKWMLSRYAPGLPIIRV